MTTKKQKKGISAKETRRREKQAKKQAKKLGQVQASTPNGQRIVNTLVSSGIGSPARYKDYVLFVGDRMLDWAATHTVVRESQEAEESGDIFVLHKSKLHQVLGDDIAKDFWDRGKARRVHHVLDAPAED